MCIFLAQSNDKCGEGAKKAWCLSWQMPTLQPMTEKRLATVRHDWACSRGVHSVTTRFPSCPIRHDAELLPRRRPEPGRDLVPGDRCCSIGDRLWGIGAHPEPEGLFSVRRSGTCVEAFLIPDHDLYGSQEGCERVLVPDTMHAFASRPINCS